MEENIDEYLAGDAATTGESVSATNPSNSFPPLSVGFTDRGEASQ